MNLYNIEVFNTLIEETLDNQNNVIFICCASFEERSKVLPLKIPPVKLKAALICEHREVEQFVTKNAKELHNHFGKKSKKVVLSLSDPIETADSLIESLERIRTNKPHCFLIDITTFTHESLLILLKLLPLFGKRNDVIKFIYATALDYSSNLKKQNNISETIGSIGDNYDNSRWLSKGIKEIRSIIGYPGVLLPSRKLHLIILAGYEVERASKIIENYEANFVSIGIGNVSESISSKLYEINKTYHKRLSTFYQNVESFSFSLNNPANTKRDIQSQINKHSNCNTIIAPLNTKISTIGAALATLENSEIQLSYAQANFYNVENYSSPGNEFYMFDLSTFFDEKAQLENQR